MKLKFKNIAALACGDHPAAMAAFVRIPLKNLDPNRPGDWYALAGAVDAVIDHLIDIRGALKKEAKRLT